MHSRTSPFPAQWFVVVRRGFALALVAPSTQAAMVTTPWQFGGAVIQRALRSGDPMVQVPRVIQQMRRVARAAEVRAASELEAARVCVEVLPTDGEVRRGYPLPSPPARLDVKLRVPPRLRSCGCLRLDASLMPWRPGHA
jgi:hypothetical protein